LNVTAQNSPHQPDSALNSKEFLSANDLAALMGVHRRTVRLWLANGAIPSVRLGGARRVRRSDIDAMFDQAKAS
jgi:excisionase family DNA binding protein